MAIGVSPGGTFLTGDLTRSGHQLGVDTGTVNPLYIEEYGGMVESQIIKTSIMKQFVSMKSIRGTDTVTNDRIGTTSLQAVSPGVRPDPGVAEFDNVSVKVDTIILARNNVNLLADFQAHYNVRAELGMDHGKIIGRFFDEAICIQGVKAASIVKGDGTAGTTKLPEGWKGGVQIDLASAADEDDSAKLQRAIEDLVEGIELNDIEIEGAALFVNPTQYYVLQRNDKLISGDYSTGNGDYANGTVLKSCGVPIFKTNRLPQETVTGHYLSNAGNNNAYDVSAEEAKVVALLLMPKALLAGETIPLTSKVYYSDVELQWFIDSYLAFGVTPNRAEMAGIVRKA
jgi:hypothetical protein